MKPNSDLLFQHLLRAFNGESQKRHSQHAPLIKCIEMALIDYHYDERVLYPNWLEWLVATNNALHTLAHQGYSAASIQCVHELLRDRLAHYDRSVKKAQSENVSEADFMVEYGFHDYSLILKHTHQPTPDDLLMSMQESAMDASAMLSPDNPSATSPLRQFSFLLQAVSMPLKGSLSLGNG